MATAKQRAQWKKWQAASAKKRRKVSPNFYSVVSRSSVSRRFAINTFATKSAAKKFAKRSGSAIGMVKAASVNAFKMEKVR